MRRQAGKEAVEAIAQEQPVTPMAARVFSSEIDISTKGDLDMIDVTSHLERLVHDSGIQEGIACVFIGGSTGAITTMEFEPGVVADLRAALQRLAPSGIDYQHHLKWKDGNGHSHVRAALLGPSITIPIREGEPATGTWQQVVFIELDARPRKRSLLVQVMGTV
jgi:secondary thiamine-phosphate synthase enzyme